MSLVAILWQPAEPHLLALRGLPLWVARGCQIAVLAMFVWSAYALRPFDPLGLAPIQAHLHGRPDQPSPFVVQGPYRWVRHPLYAGFIVLIWSSPDLTADRLLFNILWTAWICAGAIWEEADLVAEFGAIYQAYRRKVPMLIPWRGSVVFQPFSGAAAVEAAEQPEAQ